jgi:hypothetical protein
LEFFRICFQFLQRMLKPEGKFGLRITISRAIRFLARIQLEGNDPTSGRKRLQETEKTARRRVRADRSQGQRCATGITLPG